MFENIIGNNEIKNILIKSIKQNNTSHSYLFIGTQGIGKKLIAIEFAKMLLCNGNEKYCNNCKSCIEFNTKNHPDFLCIEPDGNSIKIDQIRMLQKEIQEKPIISNKKVYIINDADYMTVEAQNCLLKTLEEPPEFATIILIGSNENSFLTTIKSRCLILHFRNIENNQIKKFLEEKYQIKDVNNNILDTFQGSIGKAIALKDKQEEYENIQEMINNLENKDLIDIIKLAEPLYKSKEEIFEILDYINIILLKKAKEKSRYAKCIDYVEDTKIRIKQNANYDMCIDNMVFNIWEEVN